MRTNKFGLTRDIPNAVKRSVRQRCGFGCVICGLAIYQYEHIEPTFSEAKTHDANAITLLCGACHDRVTRGLLSKETVSQANLNPYAKKSGYSFGPFDVGGAHPRVIVGAFQADRTRLIIRAFGDSILCVDSPEEQGAPFRLSALLCDASGTEVLQIDDNEWKAPSTNWDVEVVGQKISIKRNLGDVIMILKTIPPHTIVLEKLDMYYKGAHFLANGQDQFKVIMPSGRSIDVSAMKVDNCSVGLDITKDVLSIGQGGAVGLSMRINREAPPAPRVMPLPKLGRNVTCFCGSGVKYKKCHGA